MGVRTLTRGAWFWSRGVRDFHSFFNRWAKLHYKLLHKLYLVDCNLRLCFEIPLAMLGSVRRLQDFIQTLLLSLKIVFFVGDKQPDQSMSMGILNNLGYFFQFGIFSDLLYNILLRDMDFCTGKPLLELFWLLCRLQNDFTSFKVGFIGLL